MKEVESDENDFNGRSSWANSWQTMFFSLYCIVMFFSLFFYLCLLRAIALGNRSKETPTYFFMVLLFFTSLVEDALVIQQFITLHHDSVHTPVTCRLFTYVLFGNKILQPLIVMTMLIYTYLLVEMKNTPVQQKTKEYFPMLVLVMWGIELFLTIWPTMNVTSGATGQYCYHIDDSYETERRTGWLYHLIFPFILPLVIGLVPALLILNKLRRGLIVACQEVPVNLALVLAASFFFFHLLYYTLMLGREAEALALDRADWRRLLGLHVWYITRPMFALIAYGWHVVVPLAPFAFDHDFFNVFPGTWINRRRIALKEESSRNSFRMNEPSPRKKNPAKSDESDPKLSFENPLASAMEADNQSMC